ncbi:site-specific DNA-methyltransferase [candidate division WOR-3 bacterium]|nr:site-specific DNA-methyltransferase [candidate division WOR-3 bacterium]
MSTHKIICGDCIEVMHKLDSESIDLVLTSPPYDNLRDYKGYSFDFESVAKELFRILKEGAVVVWVVGDATVNGSETGTSFKQALYFKELGFNLHDTMIYAKYGSSMAGSNKCYMQMFEYMFILSKEKIKTTNLLYDRKNQTAGAVRKGSSMARLNKNGIRKKSKSIAVTKDYGKRYNIWYFSPSHKTGHPAVFNEQLAHDHIHSWSNQGDTVLDPFVGSGTTLVAAEKTGRNSIGIGISTDYCKLAYKRLNKIVNQTKLTGEKSNITFI